VRGVVSWASGAVLAFLLTAGAFLLLANLGTGPSERSLPPDPRSGASGPSLALSLEADQLVSLDRFPDQKLVLGVSNEGDRDLSDVNLTLKVFSENTAISEARYYRATVRSLSAGETIDANFEVDLSPPIGAGRAYSGGSDPPREIIEVRATTPEGVSAVKTAILPRRTRP
jgi:hypothetical protein